MALAFPKFRPGQKPSQAKGQARLGPAFFGLAWPGFWLQAGAGTSLFVAYWRSGQRQRRHFPPGPKKLPFIGNLLSIPRRAEWETFECHSEFPLIPINYHPQGFPATLGSFRVLTSEGADAEISACHSFPCHRTPRLTSSNTYPSPRLLNASPRSGDRHRSHTRGGGILHTFSIALIGVGFTRERSSRFDVGDVLVIIVPAYLGGGGS